MLSVCLLLICFQCLTFKLQLNLLDFNAALSLLLALSIIIERIQVGISITWRLCGHNGVVARLMMLIRAE